MSQNKVWSTLEKDALFSRGFGTPSLEDQRKLSFQRVRRLYEYNFLPDEELFQNPLRHQVLTNCIGSFDWTVAAKMSLNSEVFHIYLLSCMIMYQCFQVIWSFTDPQAPPSWRRKYDQPSPGNLDGINAMTLHSAKPKRQSATVFSVALLPRASCFALAFSVAIRSLALHASYSHPQSLRSLGLCTRFAHACFLRFALIKIYKKRVCLNRLKML